MEVRFAPELEKQLNDLAAHSGRAPGELIQEAVAGYVSDLSQTRAMLDSRYDDIKSGREKLIDGEEAFARLHERIEARRNRPE
jgi:predicted DNA-binding protein